MNTPSPLSVRTAVPTDRDLIVRFQLTMAMESENLALDPATVTRGVERVLKDSTLGEYLVTTENGGPTGCVLLQREWSDWRAKWVYWIHSLYVIPEYRRQGTFKKLYELLKNRAQNDSDCSGLRLYVDRGNLTAQRAYEKVGMTQDHYVLYEWLKES